MTNYVERYQSLEAKASGHEKAAEEYKRRAEEDRWEQCRIAHEAVESGGFSRRKFAEAVGKSQTTVSRQCRMWERWGESARTNRPTYWEAQAEIRNDSTGQDRTREIARAGVRNLPAEDKRQTFKELAADPDVADDVRTRAEVTRSLTVASGRAEQQTERQQSQQSKGLRATTELMQAIALMTDVEDKAARVGRIWREHAASWTAEERDTFRDAWQEAAAEVGHTDAALATDGGWDSALASLVNEGA